MHLNPIRAGLVKDLKSLNAYPWSGHSVLVGTVERKWQNTDEILGYFSERRETAIEFYIEFMNDGIKRGKRDDLVGGGLKRSAGLTQLIGKGEKVVKDNSVKLLS